MSSSKVGRCEQTAVHIAPLLTAGNVTPEALRAWEMGCLLFFLHKDVAEKEQVGKIAWTLQDPRVQDWYLSDCDCIHTLSFPDFMKEVRAYWLPSDWAAVLRLKMMSSTQGNKPFHVWAAEVQSQNVLLRGDPSHMTDAALRYHLESHMHVDLNTDYRVANIDMEKDLCKWIERVRVLDEKHLCKAARMDAAAIHASKRQPLQTSHSANVKEGKSTADSKTRTRLLPLTDGEQTLLQENSGCFKCRWFFHNHVTSLCPNNFPDANGYTTLTAADVEAVCTKKCLKPVAAVVEDKPVPKWICTEDAVVEPIVVVMPPSTALSDGSDSGDGYTAPFSVPHFFWSCLLDGPNDSSSSVDVLIDHGSHLVLIKATLVEKLGLRPCMLPMPFDVSVAVSPNNHKALSLSQYVQLSCHSLDSQFRSCPFHAIVAPRLKVAWTLSFVRVLFVPSWHHGFVCRSYWEDPSCTVIASLLTTNYRHVLVKILGTIC